jgi:hypothetical protein
MRAAAPTLGEPSRRGFARRKPGSPCVLKPGTAAWARLWPRLTMPDPGDRELPVECAPRRPTCRDECRTGLRPCPWIGCAWHRYLSVGRNGTIWVNFPNVLPWELEDSCLLDELERAGGEELTLGRIGELVNLTKERIRQVETQALAVLRDAHGEVDD